MSATAPRYTAGGSGATAAPKPPPPDASGRSMAMLQMRKAMASSAPKKRKASSYVMEKSPYEKYRPGSNGSRTAEHGEPLFDKLRHMVDPYGAKQQDDAEDEEDDASSSNQSGASSRRSDDNIESSEPEEYDENNPFVHPGLIDPMGGDSNAKAFVQAYHQVKKSGMCFSAKWVGEKFEGEKGEDKSGEEKTSKASSLLSPTTTTSGRRSRGDLKGQTEEFVRQLPKPMLLLTLQRERIVATQDAVLKEMILDLDLLSKVSSALSAWDLERDFPQIATACEMEDLQVFSKQKASNYKCIIFLARAITVLRVFERENWSTRDQKLEATTLWDKMNSYLKLLNANVQLNPQRVAVWKEQKEQASAHNEADAAASAASSSMNDTDTQESESAASRPSRGGIHNNGIAEVSDTTATGSNSTSGAARSSRSSKKQKRSGSRFSFSTAPLPASLGADLQQQHDRLGDSVSFIPCAQLKQQHDQLGRAIASLRAQIDVDPEELRAQWREELREELLEEMEEATNSSGRSKTKKRRRSH